MKKAYERLSASMMGKLEKKGINGLGFIVLTVFVFGLFYWMTRCTPLAGDDWGYALNGMQGNPIALAIQFYNTWSGRFFSELWGFVVAPRKWLWDILNPFLFTTIFVFTVLLTAKRKTLLASSLIVLAMMLNVSSDLRMETYTWIMGDTYVIPLMMSLVYLYLAETKVVNRKKTPTWTLIATSALCFYIGLTMENIAAVMIFAILLLAGAHFYYQRRISWTLAANFACSVVSLAIMRLSPGSTYRLMNDHLVWTKMPLLDKLAKNMPYFIRYSFIDNKFLIAMLCVVLAMIGLKRAAKRPSLKNIALALLASGYLFATTCVAFANSFVNVLKLDFMAFFLQETHPLVWLFWFLFVAVVFVLVMLWVSDLKLRQKILFFVVIGGASNAVMMISPIFGSRSSLYFVYFILAAIVLLYQELNLRDGMIVIGFSLICVLLAAMRAREFVIKYEQVAEVYQERRSIIQYYLDHPEIKEVHIPRMPPYSVHGADIEEDDFYHIETFKEYFGLAPDATLIFEWKESYD